MTDKTQPTALAEITAPISADLRGIEQEARELPEPSPTAGMNLGQRILHVGGRENAAGYIEFGSVAAVRALVGQVLRDLPSRAEPAQCVHQIAEPVPDLRPEGVSTLDLTQERLKAYLSYDPTTGVFTSLMSGKKIGWKGWKGYVSVTVYDVTYRAHRLAWLYMTGEWPEALIDHRDGDRSNNRFSNLRESTHSQNSANGKAKPAASGLPRGVRKSTNSRMFKAEITVHNRRIHLGNFTTVEEASEVYTLASELLHGDYAYHLSR